MAKRKTDFSETDRQMAARALWIAEGKPAAGPADFDPARLFAIKDETGFSPPLAHFGMQRWMDAQRDSPQVPDNPLLKLRGRVSSEEKAAYLAVLEAHQALGKAQNAWEKALALRSEIAAVAGHVGTTEYPRLPLEQLGQAVEKVAVALARHRRPFDLANVRNPFPSLLGLSALERKKALNVQRARLEQAKVSRVDLTFVMDGILPKNSAERVRARDRTRQRTREFVRQAKTSRSKT